MTLESNRTVGGQPGNQNAAKGRRFRDALRRELAKRHGSVENGYQYLASRLLDQVDAGELAAIREAADREDGKPAQTNIHQGDEDGGPVRTHWTVEGLSANAPTADET